MVELQTSQLDTPFHALGDATGRQLLRNLANGMNTVSELAVPFAMSLAAASKHIKALESEVHGRTHISFLEAGPLAKAQDWLSYYQTFWTDRLNILDRLLREEDQNKNKGKKK